MRTSFHHQPEAQHPNFPLSTSGRPITPSLPPLATELMRRNELPLCANSDRMHRSKNVSFIR